MEFQVSEQFDQSVMVKEKRISNTLLAIPKGPMMTDGKIPLLGHC